MATLMIYSSQATMQDLTDTVVLQANRDAKAAFWVGVNPLPPAEQGLTIPANDLLNLRSKNTLEIVASYLKIRTNTTLKSAFRNNAYLQNPVAVNITQLVATVLGDTHIFKFRIHANIINTITLNYTKHLKIELGSDTTGQICLFLSPVVPPVGYVLAMNGAFPPDYAAFLGRTNPSGGVKIP